MIRRLLPALLLVALASCAPEAPPPGAGADDDANEAGQPRESADLAPYFAGREGTFVLLDARSGETIRHNPERARTGFLPASTFKIPNTLIALETGVADGPNFFLRRDTILAPTESWWPASWREDHTLRTALPNSVVWYYQELARRVGSERMQGYLDRFDYGNADISGGIDEFWLSGGLRISADEQVDFLRRFLDGELGVSQRNTELVKELLLLEEAPTYRLSGKTGWASFDDPDIPQIGWFVGYLERGEELHIFALNLRVRNDEDVAARQEITRAILRDRGLIPQ